MKGYPWCLISRGRIMNGHGYANRATALYVLRRKFAECPSLKKLDVKIVWLEYLQN